MSQCANERFRPGQDETGYLLKDILLLGTAPGCEPCAAVAPMLKEIAKIAADAAPSLVVGRFDISLSAATLHSPTKCLFNLICSGILQHRRNCERHPWRLVLRGAGQVRRQPPPAAYAARGRAAIWPWAPMGHIAIWPMGAEPARPPRRPPWLALRRPGATPVHFTPGKVCPTDSQLNLN